MHIFTPPQAKKTGYPKFLTNGSRILRLLSLMAPEVFKGARNVGAGNWCGTIFPPGEGIQEYPIQCGAGRCIAVGVAAENVSFGVCKGRCPVHFVRPRRRDCSLLIFFRVFAASFRACGAAWFATARFRFWHQLRGLWLRFPRFLFEIALAFLWGPSPRHGATALDVKGDIPWIAFFLCFYWKQTGDSQASKILFPKTGGSWRGIFLDIRGFEWIGESVESAFGIFRPHFAIQLPCSGPRGWFPGIGERRGTLNIFKEGAGPEDDSPAGTKPHNLSGQSGGEAPTAGMGIGASVPPRRR